MKQRVTLKEIANRVGVHVSTVSRALDPKTRHRINPKVVEKIVSVSEELDYRQNTAAYSLRTNRTRTIGVIIPDITNPIFPPIIRGIEDSLAASGYVAIVGNTDGNHQRERHLMDTFLGRGVDGLVLASVERDDDALNSAIAEGVPIVTVNRRVDKPTVSSVVHDDDEGIRRVLTHLVSLGHRKIANIAGPQTFSTGAERYAAFERYRSAMGLDPDPRLVVFADAYNEIDGEGCVEELIAAGSEFSAIVCANDRLAMGAITALNRRNLRCPSDVSVTGYNDMLMVDRINPPLTTVRIHQYRLGTEAGALLQKMIGTDYSPEHMVLPVELVIRGSTQAVKKAM
ncbi:LacI family transcriptional regulator [Ensifer adhaerens]|uniref:LacI family DNA-binding transcriptional regulator n=1 Tax=Ensifer adhaerens TaxID=106592 RepID=UPI001CBDF3C1|nr:LacI family DNA-binding transcriptional regulator [Ensifer adhaerens]MBZ7924787.1 LacI family transcriptional regulator [Ensifer adhaerens]UAX95992.1 LacI family transcriptional regulator [Ensifer adhaerens]UAY04666.1 LacI family transcriptional regulator [Ensifer adhaerens]UAY10097.1 LacI family transcriptional regulator [Ensifer adhaerens]